MSKLDVQIYGRYSCPYCVRANAIFEELKEAGQADGQFHDMIALNITKEDLSAKAGKECRTVPQVWVNGQHIGGCDNFMEWLNKNGYQFKS